MHVDGSAELVEGFGIDTYLTLVRICCKFEVPILYVCIILKNIGIDFRFKVIDVEGRKINIQIW